ASVSFDEDSPPWTAERGRNGQGLDPAPLVAAVSEKAPALEDFAVEQPVEEIAPAITTAEAEETVGSIATLLEQPMSITGADGETHEVSAERRNGWISVEPDEDGQALTIAVDEDAVREWVSARADSDAVEVEDGIEQVGEDGEVVKVLTEKKAGLEITNTDAVADELIAAMKGTTPLEAAFDSKKIEPEVEQVEAPKDEEEAGDEESTTPSNPTGEKWIDVDLTNKTVTAYVGDTP